MTIERKILISAEETKVDPFRPRSLGEIVGQEDAKNSLVRAMLSKQPPRVLLLHGPSGTGKFWAACLVASFLHCANHSVRGQTLEPCGRCEHCLAGLSKHTGDFHVVHSASLEAVSDVRHELGKLGVGGLIIPSFIAIQDAECLTANQWDVLSPILRKPPHGAMLFVLSNDVELLPDAVLEKIDHQFGFERVDHDALVLQLASVAKDVSDDVSPDVLQSLAVQADGCQRTAMKLLENHLANNTPVPTRQQPAPWNELPDQVVTDWRQTAAEVEYHHAEVGWSQSQALHHAIHAGVWLCAVEAKRHLPGEFSQWLKENTSLSIRTSQVYRRLARHREFLATHMRRTSAPLSINKALQLITDAESRNEGPRIRKQPEAHENLWTKYEKMSDKQRRKFHRLLKRKRNTAVLEGYWTKQMRKEAKNGPIRAKKASVALQ